MTNSNQESDYYNNSTTTTCYLNKVVRITPKQGEPYISIQASMLDGKMSSPSYQDVDLNIKGKQALEVLESVEGSWPNFNQPFQERPKFFATIRFGSLGIKAYTKNNGENGVTLSGRLLEITYLSINKQEVFRKKENDVNSNAEAAPQQVEQPSAAPVQRGNQPVSQPQPMVDHEQQGITPQQFNQPDVAPVHYGNQPVSQGQPMVGHGQQGITPQQFTEPAGYTAA